MPCRGFRHQSPMMGNLWGEEGGWDHPCFIDKERSCSVAALPLVCTPCLALHILSLESSLPSMAPAIDFFTSCSSGLLLARFSHSAVALTWTHMCHSHPPPCHSPTMLMSSHSGGRAINVPACAHTHACFALLVCGPLAHLLTYNRWVCGRLRLSADRRAPSRTGPASTPCCLW